MLTKLTLDTSNVDRVYQIQRDIIDSEFIQLDKLPSGKWVLSYTKDSIPDITDFHSIDINYSNKL